MSNVQFNIQVNSNATSVLSNIETALGNVTVRTRGVTSGFSECVNKLLTINQSIQGLTQLKQTIDDIISPGIKLNTNMADLSAITGITGDKLKEIEMAARASAKAFGNDAAQGVESYKLILSQLDPAIAQNSTALKAMGDNVNILSKTMGGNTVAATEVLTTAMNQYGVSTKNPIEASRQMAEMMNIMAAGAKEGSAELPQIKAALEQSGMMAKTANVSFAELNATIQVLDKAGKKGAEGGTAVRNVLAKMSEGAYGSKQTIQMLEASGVNVAMLSDKSLTFSQRLALLKPIVADTGKMTQMFGTENVAAAMALVQNTSAIDDYKGKIVGTNTAVEQATVVMGSYQERMNRVKASFDDFKISIFNTTQAYLPYIQSSLDAVISGGQVASGLNSINTLFNNDAIKKFTKDFSILTTIKKAYASVINSVRNATMQATVAQWEFNVALINNPIGWIVGAIAALVAVVYLLWQNFKPFRETLFGVWEAAKAVFTNIGTIVMRIWEMVLKPIFSGIWAIAKFVFNGIWLVVKTVFGAIVGYYQLMWGVAVAVWTGIYNTVTSVVGWIWNAIKAVGAAIADFFGGIWSWISSIFKGVGQFVNEWIIKPMTDAFNGLWNIITGIFGKIMEKMKALFAPIVAIWNKVFSKDGLTDVSAAYEEGKKKGGESFDKDQADKKEKEAATQNPLSPLAGMKGMQTMGISMAAGMGGKAANSAKTGKEMSSNITAGGSKPTTIHLTIQKVIGIGELKTTNLVGAAKEAGNQVVEEVLMALQSVNGKVSTQ